MSYDIGIVRPAEGRGWVVYDRSSTECHAGEARERAKRLLQAADQADTRNGMDASLDDGQLSLVGVSQGMLPPPGVSRRSDFQRPRQGTKRHQVLVALHVAAANGMTAAEMDYHYEWTHTERSGSPAAKRLSDLHRAGYATRTDRKRGGESVYEVSGAGRQALMVDKSIAS